VIPTLCLPETGQQALYGIRAVDGDTFDAAFLLATRVRLFGCNAPEHNQPGGKEAKDFLKEIVEGQLLTVELRSHEKYGRLLADVMVGGRPLWEIMVEKGLVKPWDGKGPRP
jgi:endonuclease YncB( thermonuclease family)